jgi:very-short-patch-repair endonuclease
MLERLLADLSRGPESYLEHVALTRVFNTRDFRGFGRQVPVRAPGQRYILDMFHADARVAVELDGRLFHGDDIARRRDLARDTDLASMGITTIRLTFEDITRRPHWCRARVRAAIVARQRRGVA